MANAEQIAILKKGVAAWNEWRENHPEVVVDLSDTDFCQVELNEGGFRGANLREANLRHVSLHQADLREAILCGANLSTSVLSGADFRGADLREANLRQAYLDQSSLSRANLRGANLNEADLKAANLRGTDLREVQLFAANLRGADLSETKLFATNLTVAKLDSASFTEAVLGMTTFGHTSLKSAKGLDTCKHEGPSVLDYDTLMASGPLPEVFLRGCGLSDEFIRYLPSFWNQPFEFYSCFISYSHTDKNFARRLHDALQGRGIRCWLDEHQLLPGDLVHAAVDEGIRLWDKVLLCASEASLTSWWVDKEIRKALAKEEQLWKERGKEVLSLIPLNLDGFMFQKTWTDWKKEHLTSRLAADFTEWRNDDDEFNAQLEQVIKALRADGRARERAPKPKL
jgi:hypothetical protein